MDPNVSVKLNAHTLKLLRALQPDELKKVISDIGTCAEMVDGSDITAALLFSLRDVVRAVFEDMPV